jgi:hypothetical protein
MLMNREEGRTAPQQGGGAVNFDLGLQGLGTLVVMSLVFGAVAQVVLGRGTTPWMWLIGATAWFFGGLFASEVVFSSATVDELQPIIDGLALDESMLGGLLLGVPVVLVTWYVTRHGGAHRPMSS